MNERKNYAISELNGYLQCLSRMQKMRSCFGAKAYDASFDVDTFGLKLAEGWSTSNEYYNAKKHVYSGKEEINFRTLDEEMLGFVFSSSKDRGKLDRLGRIFMEDINEFFGLASINLNKEGIFHPLISGPVFKLKFESNRFSKGLHFVVRIEDMYVLTYFQFLLND